MEKQINGIIGVTHVDIAWKKDVEEMSELYEDVIVRLLDILEHHDDFTYVLEQAYLLRMLDERRPDLIDRLRPFVDNGRLSIVGGMVSTSETNTVSGESLVRNIQAGQRWFLGRLGKKATVGWLIDTFGMNAQFPQLAAQFGYRYVFANRLGGNVPFTMLQAKGKDGTVIPVIGRDVYAPAELDDGLSFRHVSRWKEYDQLFNEADCGAAELPLRLFMPYTENEVLPSTRSLTLRKAPGTRRTWEYATPDSICDSVLSLSGKWPMLDADLNPEFTGTFSNRIALRKRYRECESRLQQLHTMVALFFRKAHDADLLELFDWDMGYLQAHDLITGSFQDDVFQDAIRRVDSLIARIDSYEKALFQGPQPEPGRYSVFAGNCGSWRIPMQLDVGFPISKVLCNGREVPFVQYGDSVEIAEALPPYSISDIRCVAGEHGAGCFEEDDRYWIDNGIVSVSADTERKTCSIAAGGRCYGISLVMQKDVGNFQIEEPAGSEVDWIVSSMTVSSVRTPVYQELRISGEFPEDALGFKASRQPWSMSLRLYQDSPYVSVSIAVPWEYEMARMRVKVTTPYEFTSMLNEIPFGTTRRQYYRERGTAKGEWPVLRYSVVDSDDCGIALVNTGNCGIESRPRSLYMTIVRAPYTEYAGMYPDESSSQHGIVETALTILPFTGPWYDASIPELAEMVNHGVSIQEGCGGDVDSRMIIKGSGVVVSSVEAVAPDTVSIRLYETAGTKGHFSLRMPGVREYRMSDIYGNRGDLLCKDESLEMEIAPYRILTVAAVY